MDNANSNKDMTQDEFIKYLADQRIEMEKHKWIESEKVGYDLGNVAVMDWIRKYAKQYRESYNILH